jgi:four helix bundle protein
MELAREIYGLTEKFPQKEQFGLCDQMKRAAISIPSNIVEGYRRGSKKDYAHFVSIAHGSLSELETQLLLAQSVYPRSAYTKAIGLAEEIGRMLYGLSRVLKN